MRTVLVEPGGQHTGSTAKPTHIDEITADLTVFLRELSAWEGERLNRPCAASSGK